ncbi:hypothetical protein GCM10009721_19070 [Terrabacter tumescens]|uniref:Uncharacterized protein n=1 Tax=Terrabacter tumescens TaxID=60443 RepID=A0ABQ2HY70_9MICO|nr:hypothetical protein [Terrabacter tumescens]GGM93276.1 hypothetical protein GCM10009721_19070 [Terrabacter tumescens]
MGWLSRTFKPDADHAGTAGPDAGGAPPVPPVPVPAPTATAAPAPATSGPSAPAPAAPAGPGPMGRYGPLVCVTHFDTAAPELEWQLPLNGELYRLIPGSDRPDYSLLVLDRPLHFYPGEGFDLGRVEADQQVQDRKGRTMVRVHALLLCARFVGQQLHPGMTDLAVNLAYVIDNSLARDAEVDFGKIEFAGIGFLSEGHAPRADAAPAAPSGQPSAATEPEPAPEPVADSVPQPSSEAAPEPLPVIQTETETLPETLTEPTLGTGPAAAVGAEATTRHTSSEVLDDLARTLRQGIEEQRGAPVQRMTAALTIDPDLRLTGLSGNADGQAPVPTQETFGRLAEVLGRLGEVEGSERVAAVTLRVDGDDVSHDVTGTHR